MSEKHLPIMGGGYDRIVCDLDGTAWVREQTCEVDNTISWAWNGWTKFYEHELSCGHVITSVDKEPPKFCEECGAKVVDA